MGAFAVGARDLDRSLIGLDRAHPFHELVNEVAAEAGPDLAGVSELALLLRREEERAEAETLVALRPADDDEFLTLDAFDLEPVAGAGALIWRIGLLGD